MERSDWSRHILEFGTTRYAQCYQTPFSRAFKGLGHETSRQARQLHRKKLSRHFFLRFCVLTIYRHAYLFVLFHRNAGCCFLSNVLAAIWLFDLVGVATYFA